MRISDWSSDVCSYDLPPLPQRRGCASHFQTDLPGRNCAYLRPRFRRKFFDRTLLRLFPPRRAVGIERDRSEERRVGKDVSVRVDLGGRRIITKKKTDRA